METHKSIICRDTDSNPDHDTKAEVKGQLNWAIHWVKRVRHATKLKTEKEFRKAAIKLLYTL